MAGKAEPAAVKRLQKDVGKVLKLAARKDGATGEDVAKAIGLEGVHADFMCYRYRNVLAAARKAGLKRNGFGRGAVWRFKKK